MRTGLLYLMVCSFTFGYYCAKNDVAGELRELYDSLVDYTAARAVEQKQRTERRLAGELELAGTGAA